VPDRGRRRAQVCSRETVAYFSERHCCSLDGRSIHPVLERDPVRQLELHEPGRRLPRIDSRDTHELVNGQRTYPKLLEQQLRDRAERCRLELNRNEVEELEDFTGTRHRRGTQAEERVGAV